MSAALPGIDKRSIMYEKMFPFVTGIKNELLSIENIHSHSSVRDCPVCRGKSTMVVNMKNGKFSGRCRTKDCVTWNG
jgi:hypothetical protein